MQYAETSREAFKEFKPVSATLDSLIIGALTDEPLICQDIELKIGRSHQAVSGNLRHLVERGTIEFSGDYGRTTSNRRAKMWRLTTITS